MSHLKIVPAWWSDYSMGREKARKCLFYSSKLRTCKLWDEAVALKRLYLDYCLRCTNASEEAAVKYLLIHSKALLDWWVRRTMSSARELKAEIFEYQRKDRPFDRRLFPAEWTRACARTAIAERDRITRLVARLDELEKGATTQ